MKIRKTAITAALCMCCMNLIAQTTNTYPQDGDVGIGTTTPGYKLDVVGAGHFTNSIWNVGGDLNNLRGVGNYAGYNLANSPSSTGWVMVSNYSNGYDQVFQLAYDQYQSGKLFTRYSASGGADWSSWKTLINSDAISGTANYLSKFNGVSSVTSSIIYDDGYNIGIGTPSPKANLDVSTNAIVGNGGSKFNTALTLVKNGDIYGIDNPVLLIKHSGNGVNSYGNPLSDHGVLQITGFNTSVSNKSINSNDNFFVFTNGTVGVNTSHVPGGYSLAVGGNAIAESMTVKLQSVWPDYVFKDAYAPMPLSRLQTYLKTYHHLPELPSAADMKKDGLNLGALNTVLVKKVEELTLYLIEKDKALAEQQELVKKQESRIKAIERLLKIIPQSNRRWIRKSFY